MAQSEPVRVQRQGRDVAMVLSPEEFGRLSEAGQGRVSPAAERACMPKASSAGRVSTKPRPGRTPWPD